MKKQLSTLLIVLLTALGASAQDDELDALLGGSNEVEYTTKTFYSSRIVNSHTTEMLNKKTLDFRINHRFGDISEGYSNFFGLDNATMRMSFDYGITISGCAGFMCRTRI